jgi:uncharacterized protein
MSLKQIVQPVVVVCAIICALLATAAFAFSTPERTGWVTDQAGILDAPTAAAITEQLDEHLHKTGDEVVVVTLESLQGAAIETWGNVLGESWGVGRGNHDTGVLLVVAPNDRKVRIAVGYGLGNRISDSVAAMIIGDHIIPYFKQGDFAGGVKAGVNSILLQLDRPQGVTAAPSNLNVERGAYPVQVQRQSFWQWLRWKLTPSHDTKVIAIWVAIFVVVFIWMALNAGNIGSGRRRRYYDDDDGDYWDSSSHSHSSGGGGGFSGGGSSSSSSGGGGGSFGGGATGSW